LEPDIIREERRSGNTRSERASTCEFERFPKRAASPSKQRIPRHALPQLLPHAAVMVARAMMRVAVLPVVALGNRYCALDLPGAVFYALFDLPGTVLDTPTELMRRALDSSARRRVARPDGWRVARLALLGISRACHCQENHGSDNAG
jgi:hypothetical protein